MSYYTVLSKHGNCTRLLQSINKLKSIVLTNKVGENSRYFVGVLNKTIIPLALVGQYDMIIAKLTTILYPTLTRGIIVKY